MSDYVCQELIIEIFTRLPAKSLLRFRSLSKSLCSCIGSPDFIRMHTLRSSQKLLIEHIIYNEERNMFGCYYTCHSEDQLPMFAGNGYIGIAPVEFPPRYSDIVGSCNGILCLSNYNYGFILWNPSTRHNLVLPDCPKRYSSMRQIGFGFDPIADDYKIVVLPGGEGNPLVYGVKRGTWSAIASPIPFSTEETSRVCSINGSLHWVVRRYFTKSHHILTFDLRTYAFGVVELPEPGININTSQLTTFQGSLAVVYWNVDDIWMWVMKECNNTASWSFVFKSKANQVNREILNMDLQQTSNGGFFLDTFCNGHRLWNTKIWRRLELEEFSSHSFIFDMDIFVESLQLLNIKGKGHQEKVEDVH